MNEDEIYFGQNCPDDMVQVESVITHSERKPHFDVLAGWKPGQSAHIDLYIGGRRFLILAGQAARDYGHNEPGVYIMSDVGLDVKSVAVNAAFIKYDESGERIWRKHHDERKVKKAAEVRADTASPIVHVPRSDQEPATITIPYAEYLELLKRAGRAEIVICAAVRLEDQRVIRCHRHHDGLRIASEWREAGQVASPRWRLRAFSRHAGVS